MLSIHFISDVPWQMALFFVTVFVAGIIRGCIGFGFSVLVVAVNALFLDPASLVPIVIMMEMVASLHMLITVWKDALWSKMLWISIGMLMGIPIGVYILSFAPQDILRLFISIIIFLMTVFVLKGVSYRGSMANNLFASAGLVSGFVSGVAAAGGIVIASFLSYTSLPMKQVRATLVVYLLITSAIFIPSIAIAGKLNEQIFYTIAFAIIPMFLGIVIGGKLYGLLDEKKMRLVFLWSLSVLAIIGMIRSFFSF